MTWSRTLRGRDHDGAPYADYAALRAEAPAVWVPEVDAIVVSRFDDIAEVDRNPATFSSRVAMGTRPLPILLQELFNARRRAEGRSERPISEPTPVLLTADPPTHTRQRALLSRVFTPRRVAMLEQRIAEVTEQLMHSLAARGHCEFVSEVAVPLPLTLLAEIIGVDVGDIALLKRWSDDFSGLFGAPEPHEERLLELATAAFEFEEYFGARVEERRTKARDDLLSDVVHAQDGAADPLTNDEIITMFAQVLVAGNETTTSMLTYAALILAERPDLAARLRDRIDLVPRFVDEVLRLESPIQGFWRAATCDTEIGGVEVPAGTLVLLLYGSGNRDPYAFKDPHEIDLERGAARPHLAFGVGPHFCIGAHLACTEGRIVTEHLVTRLDTIALSSEHRETTADSYLLHSLESLHLTFQEVGSP